MEATQGTPPPRRAAHEVRAGKPHDGGRPLTVVVLVHVEYVADQASLPDPRAAVEAARRAAASRAT